MQDATVQALKKQIEELEKCLETEMLSHNSVAVRDIQRRLDKLQGDYNSTCRGNANKSLSNFMSI